MDKVVKFSTKFLNHGTLFELWEEELLKTSFWSHGGEKLGLSASWVDLWALEKRKKDSNVALV